MLTDLIALPAKLGENLRRLRISQDATLEWVARQTNLSKSFLSMVESGKRSIKLADLRRLLACYTFSLGKFVTLANEPDEEMPQDAPMSIIQTKRHALLLDGSRQEGKYHLLLLRPLRTDDDMEILELFLPPQTQMTESPMIIAAEVRGIVQKGTFLLVLQGDEYRVREGEEFCYDGRIPHLFRNYTEQSLTVNFLIHPACF